MYVGHAAIAALLKGKRPRVPIALLVPIAFAPDWIDSLSHVVHHPNVIVSHSLVSVAIGATVCGLLYGFWSRSTADGLVIWLAYASHWPADLITGVKPTWATGPMIGLGLYAHPVWDFVIESVLVGVCWMVYRRSLPAESRRRSIGLLIPLGLIGMQVVFEALQRPGLSPVSLADPSTARIPSRSPVSTPHASCTAMLADSTRADHGGCSTEKGPGSEWGASGSRHAGVPDLRQ